MNPLTTAYRTLLEQLDRHFESARRSHPGIIPCRTGCSACCHGPFDVSTADILLIRQGLAALPPADRALVIARSRVLIDRMTAMAPGWSSPYAISAIGEPRFDTLSDALADEPCPLLDPAGNCRIYRDRPLVCRLIGLGMVTPGDRVIDNACPIQQNFPGYADLPPQPFDLEAFEEEEAACLEAAAIALFGTPDRTGLETTIAAAIIEVSSPA